ncbi:MAG: coat protein [Paenibacillaceae bacterium]|jgi:spore coat protein CotF|nr:coat protein [Paenibacillaceae bacterium]
MYQNQQNQPFHPQNQQNLQNLPNMNNLYHQQSQQQNMQQQNIQQQSQNTSLLPDKEWLSTVLCDLKRVSGEYTTAVTESDNQQLRQVFTDLLNSTLSLQGQLYQFMKQQNMYKAGSQAQGQEIQKQIQNSQQSGQQAFQFAQQKLGQQPVYM